MQINLRKANEFTLALEKAASRVETVGTVTFSVYGDIQPSAVDAALNEARSKLLANAEQKLQLNEAYFAIRRLRGAANERAGINALTTEIAQLGKREALLNETLSILGAAVKIGRRGIVQTVNDPKVVSAKLVAMKQRLDEPLPPSSVYGRDDLPDSLDVTVGTDATAEELRDKLAAISRKKVQVQDEITTKNFSTSITLPDSVINVLKEFKIID